MYGNDCYDEYCRFNENHKCQQLDKKPFMLCEKPSNRKLENIIKRVQQGALVLGGKG